MNAVIMTELDNAFGDALARKWLDYRTMSARERRELDNEIARLRACDPDPVIRARWDAKAREAA